ncbi:hypothetical protein GGI23_000291 [Coemansia sp. RSA 2559]|nr:hypothetical protein GGI23_000291 [Coemansia sp. RSA 2559]KAJ2869418.1 hypothetical protein GGI22_000271 [Coemansia erecta]
MDATHKGRRAHKPQQHGGGRQGGHRNAAAEMLDRMRTLVDTVAVAFDGPAPTRKDRLVETWARIQEYYTPQRQDDLRRTSITDTTIPHHLEAMLKILAHEMIETDNSVLSQPLEFGPCIEYLLQYHVLSDLADFADADMPRGVRKYVVQFFDSFVDGIPLGLLPESAIRLPLVAIMRQCQAIVEASPTTPINPLKRQEPATGDAGVQGSSTRGATTSAAYRLGQGYHSIYNDKGAVILCHDLLRLVVTLFRRLRAHGSMVHLFFDWTGGSSGSGVGSLRGSEQFILRVVIEYLLAPGFTGQLAREALVLIVQVLLLAPENRDRQVGFLLDQARVAEMLVEHMGYLYSQVPVFRPMPRSPAARLFCFDYTGLRQLPPLDRRLSRNATQSAAAGALLGYSDDVKPRLKALLARDMILRSAVQQDKRETEILKAARVILEHVDAFFLCWELIDEIAAISESEPRITAAVQSQLSNGFLRTHIVPALLAQMTSMNQAITTVSYLTDLVNVTHSAAVLDSLFVVLLGADLAPEKQQLSIGSQHRQENDDEMQVEEEEKEAEGEEEEENMLSAEDQALLASIEDDALRAEAALLLLPPGADLSRFRNSGNNSSNAAATTDAANGPSFTDTHTSLRSTLIGWMTLEDNTHLSLSTMRLFDAILATMNQFAYMSLVLRNFIEDKDDSDDGAPPNESSSSAFYSGPALGLGKSVAADQELVRAVVERFLDATPGNICNALPEAVVAAAIRIESKAEPQALSPPQLGFQRTQSPLVMREYQGCDDYVADILGRMRFNQAYLRRCWQDKRRFVAKHQANVHGVVGMAAARRDEPDEKQQQQQQHMVYPGAFLQSLVDQFSMVVKRHMAYNLLLTSMTAKLVAIADPALCAYLFLANSATVPHPPAPLLYDSYVGASADAYVKSERVPRFAARLARQRREGVETAIKVGAAHPQARNSLASSSSSTDVLRALAGSRESRSNEDAAKAAEFLGTPVKRFVHGYIVLDEFGKEMAAAAMALHTLELDGAMDRIAVRSSGMPATDDEYADILEYYDPEEPAYKRALAVQQSLRASNRPIIELGTGRSGMARRQ